MKPRLGPLSLAALLVACVGVMRPGGYFATHPATDERIQTLHRTR